MIPSDLPEERAASAAQPAAAAPSPTPVPPADPAPGPPPAVPLDEDSVDAILAHLEAGRMLTGYRMSLAFGPLDQWPAGKPRRVAAGLLHALGASRSAIALDLLNARALPDDDEFFFRALASRVGRLGWVDSIQRIEQRLAARPGMPAETRADLLALQAALLAMVRDFKPAHRLLDEAGEVAPADSWRIVQRASVLEMQDRYEDALAVAREANELRPWYRPAVFQLVDCLVQVGRDDEAMDWLRRAHEATENGCFAMRLQAFHSEREEHEAGLRWLEEFEQRSPLLDKQGREWLASRRADFSYLAGDYDRCVAACREAGEGFHEKMAEALADPERRGRTRKRLPVPFVRQHNLTCAPATLAAISRHWGDEHDHLAIVDAICHDGTPWHKERSWAEQQGYHVAEFRVTGETARALIDRHVPFTLTTSWATGAHLQACIGYDERIGTLLIRDPTHRHYGEFLLDELIKQHPVDGPRGMLFLPASESARLEGIDLPDQSVYDLRHRLALALDEHDREQAKAVVEQMRREAGGHALTRRAESDLNAYLGHLPQRRVAVEDLRRRFPEHQATMLELLGVLQQTSDRPAQVALLREAVGRKDCDPAFFSEFGELLSQDARTLTGAERFLNKAVRFRPRDSRSYHNLARCHWKRRRFDTAVQCWRAAAGLAIGQEEYSHSYFEACRARGRRDEALDFLQDRARDLGQKSAGPWITWWEALDQLNRTEEAADVMRQAFEARPDDGDLLLAASSLHAGWGRLDRADELLEQAKPRIELRRWLRTAAYRAVSKGHRDQSIGYWNQVLADEPLAVDAHAALARLLAEEHGIDAALEHLSGCHRDHPGNGALTGLYAEWLATIGPEASVPVLRELLEVNDDNLWAWRELALQLQQSGDSDAALQTARKAVDKDPLDPCNHGVLGAVLANHGDLPAAADCHRQALSLRIDYVSSVHGLIDALDTREQRLDALAYIEREMEQQVSNGDVVPAYRYRAFQLIEPPVLLDRLQRVTRQRPDLWQAWQALKDQALEMDDLAAAREAADAMVERFPLLPVVWLEEAEVAHHENRSDRRIEALQRAVELSPAYDLGVRLLAEALEHEGRYDEAEQALRRAVHLEPLSAPNHGCLADLLWKTGRTTEAFDALLHGLRLCPSYHWGWNQLARWSVALDRRQEVLDLLEQHRDRRRHLIDWWHTVANVHEAHDQQEVALEALQTGHRLHPADPGLWERLAHLLALMHRFDEALQICQGSDDRPPPIEVRARRAWITYQAGDSLEAIRQMRAITEETPDYAWPLRNLADWQAERSDWEGLENTSRAWVRLEPRAPMAWGSLAEALRALDQREEAREAMARAWTLDPSYSFGGRSLLFYQIEDKAFDDAAATLARLEHHVPSPFVVVDAMRLAMARDDREELGRRLEQLLTDPDATNEAMGYAAEQLAHHKLEGYWRRALDWHMKQDRGAEMTPAMAVAWVWAQPDLRLRGCRRRIQRSRLSDEARGAAWAALLRRASQTHALIVERCLLWNRAELRRYQQAWSQMGDALVALSLHRKGRRWMADWQQRRDQLTASDYINIAAHHDLDKDRTTAIDIRSEGLQRLQHQPNRDPLRAGLAFDLAQTGRFDEARAVHQRTDPSRLSDYFLGLHHLTEAILSAEAGNPEQAREAMQQAHQLMAQWRLDQVVSLRLQQAVKALAALVPEGRRSSGRLRRLWKLRGRQYWPLQPWLLLAGRHPLTTAVIAFLLMLFVTVAAAVISEL